MSGVSHAQIMIEEASVVEKPKYRVHCLDKEGRIMSKMNLGSNDELGAVEEAMKLSPGKSKEVWRGKSLIVHIDPRRTPGRARKVKSRLASHTARARSK